MPSSIRSLSPIEVSRVTPATSVSGAASTAALIMSAPPAAWTGRISGRSLATARAAPATVLGMSCSLRSRKTWTPLPPRTVATTVGPYRRYSSSPILTVDTYGVTSVAQCAATSISGASSATATGASLCTPVSSLGGSVDDSVDGPLERDPDSRGWDTPSDDAPDASDDVPDACDVIGASVSWEVAAAAAAATVRVARS